MPCSLSDDFSEDLLSAHESELDRMRGFYQDHKEIFQLLEKREKLWQQQLELDVRSWGIRPDIELHVYKLAGQRELAKA